MFQGVLKNANGSQQSCGYFLSLGNDFIALRQCLEHQLQFEVIGTQCVNCGGAKPIFRQGFCQSCFWSAAGRWLGDASRKVRPTWILKTRFGLRKVQLQPHIVYLALSSHLKVGVTRKSQVPTRWIDQGASRTCQWQFPTGTCGVGEVALKAIFPIKPTGVKCCKTTMNR